MAKDIETAGQGYSAKDYQDPPPAPLIDAEEFGQWSFYRAIIAEFVATLLFLYVTVLTVIGYKSQTDIANGGDNCGGVGILGIAWAFGGMIFILVYCTAGISGQYFSACYIYTFTYTHTKTLFSQNVTSWHGFLDHYVLFKCSLYKYINSYSVILKVIFCFGP